MTFVVAPGGQVVAYQGDDERFDYVYKFISDQKYNASDRSANKDILDTGTLYVAKFNDDGSGQWIPLIFGQGALTAEKGFASQADVLVKTRLAGDAVGATKMDRPDGNVLPRPSVIAIQSTSGSPIGTSGGTAPAVSAPATGAQPSAPATGPASVPAQLPNTSGEAIPGIWPMLAGLAIAATGALLRRRNRVANGEESDAPLIGVGSDGESLDS